MSEYRWDTHRPADIPPEFWAKTTAGQAGKAASAAHELAHQVVLAIPWKRLRTFIWDAHERRHEARKIANQSSEEPG